MAALVRWFNGYFLAEKPVGATVADIDLEISPKVGLQRLSTFKWSRNDIMHFTTLATFLIVAFFLNPAPIIFKFGFVGLMTLLLLVPLTSQFVLNALPIITWLLFFFSSTKIPPAYRPPISVKVLPAVETIFYGDNLSQLLATSTTPFLDILAWLPYGLIHFGLPFFVAGMLFLWGPPTAVRSFGFAFGYMNLIGVVIQLMFPSAAPWYKLLHGLDPANYSMLGSPGGLGRIDTLLHLDLYTTNFSKNSPVVFGAFPSLHSGCATMDALFLSYLFPRLQPLFFLYVTWLWWSTMYLTHHYFIDVIAGSTLSFIVFTYTKYVHLPINDKNAKNRWSYAEIRKINMFKLDPLASTWATDEESRISSSTEQFVTRTRSRSIRQQFEMDVMQSTQRQRGNSLTNPSISGSSQSLNAPSPQSIAAAAAASVMQAPKAPLTSSTVSEDSDSEVVFDPEVPRSYSRSSNTSATSIESQFDLGLGFPTSSANAKTRLD